MESDLRRQHQQQMSSGLSRDSSAPSSYLSSFVDVVGGGGGGGNAGGRAEHEQYFNGQSPSPETERIIARFMLEETQFDLQMGFMKREDEDLQKQNVFSPSSPVLYQNTSRLPFPTQNPPPSSSETEPSYASLVSSPVNHRIASLNVNGSNLTRHRSSPAGFFVNMDIDKGKHSPCENRAYPNISMGSWDGPEITHKRSRDNDRTSFSGLDASEDHQRESETPGLSLPTTEMSAMERYLQFQDSVPCKIRAKRGMATHPRSIAERVRRTRISERMRKLQELVPNMDKQTSTADMLDLAVDYIKGLQKQVKTLSEARSSCSCTRSSLDSEG